MSTSTTSHPAPKDWSATQYLKFTNERTRAVYDLIAQAAPHVTAASSTSTTPPRIYDLGCGPGNSTSVLRSVFPSAQITGMDSSPAMLSKARSSLPDVQFVQGDLRTFAPDDNNDDGGRAPDLLFSNAVFHWLRTGPRLATLSRLFAGLNPTAVLAIQVPDNYTQPSHALMRTTASLPDQPWTPYFADTAIGNLDDANRPDLDPIEPPGEWYDALVGQAQSVNVWRTEYMHVLRDAGAIVEWVKGTGLQPFLNRIESEEAKRAFLEEYERRLREVYGVLADGKVLLGYPRLFVVAVRK
ncbi:Nn.00g053050.m01.CDS01 [Neocucurbitaria sp. VM-36]